MNFKKYTNEELLMLASIANLTAEEAKDIEMEKGDYDAVTMEEYISPSYLTKPDSAHHALRRKNTFRKKEEQKTLAQSLGYDLSTENNSKRVKDLLSANHMDRTYLRGEKVEQKYLTVQKELTLMEKEQEEEYYENVALARDNMIERHDAILGSIGLDIIDLKMDLKCNDYDISNLQEELEELRVAMEEAAQKLQSAILRKNGINAAIRKKEEDYKKLDEELEQERIRRFGW